MSTVGRGLLAGAVGTCLLEATTWVDMALTGRAASSATRDTARAITDRLDADLDDNRLDAVGSLVGIGSGLAVGVAAALARAAGMRVPAPIGVVAVGAAALGATDGGMIALGVTDPKKWTATDVVRDVVPHLVYGAGVHWALDRTEPGLRADGRGHRHAAIPTTRARGDGAVTLVPDARTAGILAPGDADLKPRRSLARAVALGLATGGRSTSALLALPGPRTSGLLKASVAAAVVAELVADKLPGTPSRLEANPLLGRIGFAAVGVGALAHRRGSPVVPLALVGAAASFVGSVVGNAARDIAAERGWTWQAALVEDGVSLTLAAWALR